MSASSSTTTNCIICRKRKRDEMDDPNKTLKKKIKLSIEVVYPKFMDADDTTRLCKYPNS